MSIPERNILLSEAEVGDLALTAKPVAVKKKAGRKPKWAGVDDEGVPVAQPAEMLPAPPTEIKAKRVYKKKVKVAEPAPAPVAPAPVAPVPVPGLKNTPEGFTLIRTAVLTAWENQMGVQNALMDILQKQLRDLRAIEVEYWGLKAEHRVLIDKETARLAKGREATARYMANLVKKATK